MDRVDFERDLRQIVDEYRARCLWFLREDYYPTTARDQERVLQQIARHGDRRAFSRASQLLSWLSRLSSETSPGS